jgi:hypothetical protein
LILTLSPASTLAAPVDPPTVGDILDPGGSITVTKTVHIPPSPDIHTVTVTPAATCEPGLSATFSVPNLTVAGGTDAIFTETIAVAANAQQATTLYCTVYFLLDGVFTPDFRQDIQLTNVADSGPDISSTNTGRSRLIIRPDERSQRHV